MSAQITVEVEKRSSPGEGAIGVFEVEFRVTEVTGNLADSKLFIFHRGVESQDKMSEYAGVASMHQLSEFPGDEPDELQAQATPFWRSSSTGFLSFKTSDARDGFISGTLESLETLSKVAEDLEAPGETEVYIVTGGVALPAP